MKQLFLFLFLLSHVVIIAKKTYAPRYFTQIRIQNSHIESCDSSSDRDISVNANDQRYTLTVVHDSVTKERVKAIKSLKAISGWSTILGIASGVLARTQPLYTGADAIRYLRNVDNMCAFGLLRIASIHTSNELQKVAINIIISNNTDRELVVNDLQRGQTWYILARSILSIAVGNPEINKLRIAYSDCTDQSVDYITVQAGNVLEKKNLAYENERCWYFTNQERIEEEGFFEGETTINYVVTSYDEVNKTNYQHKEISVEEFNLIRKEK